MFLPKFNGFRGTSGLMQPVYGSMFKSLNSDIFFATSMFRGEDSETAANGQQHTQYDVLYTTTSIMLQGSNVPFSFACRCTGGDQPWASTT